MATSRDLLAFLLLAAVVAFVSADASTSAGVKAEVTALIKNKLKYPEYSSFLTYLQLGMALATTADLSPLAGSTLLIPNNKAIAALPAKSRTNVTLLRRIVPFHICNKKYTYAQIASGAFAACPTPVAPPFAAASFDIYIFRGGPLLQFGPAVTTPAVQRATALAKGKSLYLGKYFNAIGVDRVMRPPGVTV